MKLAGKLAGRILWTDIKMLADHGKLAGLKNVAAQKKDGCPVKWWKSKTG
jgi:hypothetical protein